MLRDMWQITKKDLLDFSRDKLRLITFVIMPIFMMILTGFVFPSQGSLTNTPIGIAANDTGTAGSQLVKTISDLKTSDNTNDFSIKSYSDEDAIKTAIQNQEISGGMVIPQDFSTILASNKQASVTIIQDQSNPQISALTNQILAGVTEGFSKQIGAQKIGVLLQKVKSKDTATGYVAPITTKISGVVSGDSNYFEFVAPGIIAMVVMTAVLTGLAASVSHEREQGTLDGVLVAPISRLSIILGKALAQALRGLAQGAIVLLLAVFLFGVVIHGSLWLVILLLLLGVFSFVGLGILVSASAAEQETATQILFMFQFPMLFLSGSFFPIQQMPAFMQFIAHLLPLTYAIEALRKVVILGGDISSVGYEIFILVAFGAATLAISVPLFRRLVKR